MTDDNEFISAIITNKPIADTDAEITSHGRIFNCADSDDCEGAFEIKAAGKLRKNDHLYVFNEQYYDDEKTDYASALLEAIIPQSAAKISGTLLAKATAKGKSSLAISWNKIKGVEGYDIFLSKYGKSP